MKKKLRLNELQVKSFITAVQTEKIKGGEPDLETLYSCLHYVSCDIRDCVLATQGIACTTA